MGSPKPEWDGIFQGTPVNRQGTHAGICNSTHVGVEVVWNGDIQPWSPLLLDFLLSTFTVLCHWAKITSINTQTVKGHKECNSPKTCPGAQNSMPLFRAQLAARLRQGPPVQENPLKVKSIVGSNRLFFCGAGFYNYYMAHGSIKDMGLPLTDEIPTTDELGLPCTYMVFERQVLKHSSREGVRPAILRLAQELGWFPWS
jgi:hypothetical protein